MNVLWINHRDPKHPQAGGAEVRIHEIGKRLHNYGFNVDLICERWVGSKKNEIIDGINVNRFSNKYGIHFIAPFFLIKNKKYDVVIDDIAHAMPWFSPLFTSKPVISQIHHVHQNLLTYEVGPIFGNVIGFAERHISRIYEQFIVVSESTKIDLINRLGIPEEKIIVIPNGVDCEKYITGPKSSNPSIIWTGRIKRYKRVEHVLRSFKRVKEVIPDVTLFIVGTGNYLNVLRRKVSSLDLSDVIFTNRLKEYEKIDLMSSAWVSINTSLIEGWGMTNIETAACGTPSINYNVKGLRDSVIDNLTGLLVEDGDVKGLTKALISVLSSQPLRVQLAQNAIKFANKFSWDESSKKFADLLSNSVDSGLNSKNFR